MALTGHLHDFDISYIFQIVSQEGKTGKLALQGPGGDAFVVFERGRIVSAGVFRARGSSCDGCAAFMRRRAIPSDVVAQPDDGPGL